MAPGFITHDVSVRDGSLGVGDSIVGLFVDGDVAEGSRFLNVLGLPPFITTQGDDALRGATVKIIAGAGIGESRLIVGNDSLTGEIEVANPWRTALGESSRIEILRYDAVALPSIEVQIVGDDGPGLDVRQTDAGTYAVEAEEIHGFIDTNVAGTDDDSTIGLADKVTVALASGPTGNVTVALDGAGQLRFITGNSTDGYKEVTSLTFTSSNWSAAQDVYIIGTDDLDEEGLHKAVFTLSTLFASGTATESNNNSTELLDSSFVDNGSVDIGDVIQNVTDGSSATITGVSDGKLTTTALTGGTDDTWDTGDAYAVKYAAVKYAAEEQITVDVYDNEVPGVLVLQSSGSTDVIETGDSRGTGSVALGGMTGYVNGSLDNAGERDRYAVYLEAGQTYAFSLRGSVTGDGTLGDPYLRIYDDTDTEQVPEQGVNVDDGGTGLNSLYEFTVPINKTGVYYLEAGAYADGAGTYTLSASQGQFMGALDVSEDQAFGKVPRQEIQLYLDASKTYTFDLKGSRSDDGTLRDPYLRIFDVDGNLTSNDVVDFRTYNDDGGKGYNSHLSFSPTSSGVYTIEAGAYADRGAGGTYTLTWTGIVDPTHPVNEGHPETPTESPLQDANFQELTINANGGTFTLTYAGETTGQIKYDATATGSGGQIDGVWQSVEEALESLGGLNPADVAVAKSGNVYSLVFTDVTTLLTVDDANLSQGAANTVTGETGLVDNVATDDYRIVLTSGPATGETVTVNLVADPTRTQRGAGEFGIRSFTDQVVVTDANDGDTALTFDSTNWFTPQRVNVQAKADDFVDGGDSKSFATKLDQANSIEGPLVITGGVSDDRSADLEREPIMLLGETNLKLSIGTVSDSTDFTIDINLAEEEAGVASVATTTEGGSAGTGRVVTTTVGSVGEQDGEAIYATQVLTIDAVSGTFKLALTNPNTGEVKATNSITFDPSLTSTDTRDAIETGLNGLFSTGTNDVKVKVEGSGSTYTITFTEPEGEPVEDLQFIAGSDLTRDSINEIQTITIDASSGTFNLDAPGGKAKTNLSHDISALDLKDAVKELNTPDVWEVQILSFDPAATEGTFTLNGGASITYDPNNLAQVRNGIEVALGGSNVVTVAQVVTEPKDFTVTYFTPGDQPKIVVSSANQEGLLTVVVETEGSLGIADVSVTKAATLLLSNVTGTFAVGDTINLTTTVTKVFEDRLEVELTGANIAVGAVIGNGSGATATVLGEGHLRTYTVEFTDPASTNFAPLEVDGSGLVRTVGEAIESKLGIDITSPEDLEDFTIEITRGVAKNKVRTIIGATGDVKGILTLTVDRAWQGGLTTEVPTGNSFFTIEKTNPNLLVNENEETDILTVNDTDSVVSGINRAELPAGKLTVTAGQLTGLGMSGDQVIGGRTEAGGIRYAGLEEVIVNLGSGDNLVTVNDTHAGATTINAGSGEDVIRVISISGHTFINGGNDADEITVSDNDGLLDSLGGLLTVTGDVPAVDVVTLAKGSEADDSAKVDAVNEIQKFTVNATGGTFTLSYEAKKALLETTTQGGLEAGDEVQELVINATGGEFTLRYVDADERINKTTSAITFDPNDLDGVATAIQTELNKLFANEVTVVHSETSLFGETFRITFASTAAKDAGVEPLRVNSTGLVNDGKVVTTEALAYDASGSNVETALGALTDIGAAGNVKVTKSGSTYRVEFVGALAGHDIELLRANPANLTSEGPIDTLLIDNSADSTDQTALLTSSSLTGLGMSSVNEIQTLRIDATQGRFKVSFGDVTNITEALRFDISAADLQLALEGLSGIGEGNVRVDRNDDVYTIRFRGTLTNADVDQLVATNVDLMRRIEEPGGDVSFVAGDIQVETRIEGITALVRNEVQQLMIDQETLGSFTLAFGDATDRRNVTEPLKRDIGAGELTLALEKLQGIAAGDVKVTENENVPGDFTIEFVRELSATDVPQLAVTEPTDETVTVSTRTHGIDTARNDLQALTIDADGGTFTLALQVPGLTTTFTTAPIAFDASPDEVRRALQAALALKLTQAADITKVPENFKTDFTVVKNGDTYLIGFQGKARRLDAGPGVTFLDVDDQMLTKGGDVAGTGSAVAVTRMDGINYYGIEELNIELGSGSDIVNVQGVSAGSYKYELGRTASVLTSILGNVDESIDELQILNINAVGGTYALSYDGQTTGPIGFDAADKGGGQVDGVWQSLQEALEALSNIDPGQVIVTQNGSVYSIAFDSALGDVSELQIAKNDLVTPNAVTNISLGDNADTGITTEHVFISSNADLDHDTIFTTDGNADAFDFLTGNLDDLRGDLNLDFGTGRHGLMISDEAATVGDDSIVITDTASRLRRISISLLATRISGSPD